MDLLRPSGNRYNLRRDLNLKEWNVNQINETTMEIEYDYLNLKEWNVNPDSVVFNAISG